MIRLRRRKRPQFTRIRPTAEYITRAAQQPCKYTRAEMLLHGYLSDEQRDTYARHKYIELIGSEGTRFCLHCSSYGLRVYELNRHGEHVHDFCSYVRTSRYCDTGQLPVADEILTHILLLEIDERMFRRIAPKSRVTTFKRGPH